MAAFCPKRTSCPEATGKTRRMLHQCRTNLMEVGPTGAQFGHSDPADDRCCSEWNGREIVRQCVAANAEFLVLWVRDGDYACYNSKLLPKASGLKDRDPLGDAVDEAKKLFRSAVRTLNLTPRIRITAAANVEAVVTDDPDARILRVHLIASNATPRTTPMKNCPYLLPGLIEDTPIFRASIDLLQVPRQVECLDPNTELQNSGTQVHATIENIHEVLLVHY